MENNLVVKANSIIQARYDLDLLEQKVILYAVSKIEKEQDRFNIIQIDIREFTKLIDTTVKRYTEFREIANKLMDRKVALSDRPNLDVRWLSSSEYIGNGVIELEFSEKLVPYLLQLKKRFTRYKLRNILYLKNKYSIRLYELLKSFEGLGARDFKLEEFREILMLGDKYPKFKDLNKWILKPAMKEINEQTDILVELDKIKDGRKVIGIRYSIQNKESQYIEYLNQTYDIADIKSRSGLDAEVWNSKQIMELYEIACKKTKNEDADVFEYIRLNYLQMLQNESVRNGFGYLKKALENDYAVAVGQLRMGYEVDLAL